MTVLFWIRHDIMNRSQRRFHMCHDKFGARCPQVSMPVCGAKFLFPVRRIPHDQDQVVDNFSYF